MTYFYAGKFCFINFPTIPIYFFRPRPTLPTVYPYHMACDVNLVISIRVLRAAQVRQTSRIDSHSYLTETR